MKNYIFLLFDEKAVIFYDRNIFLS